MSKSFPWSLLALDFVGAVLVAWGFYRYMGDEEGLGFIVAGFLLMTPFALGMINRGLGNSKK